MALVSKPAWQQVGGYTQLAASGWEDYDFWCKFVEHGLSCAFVPEILCRYRSHAASMSNVETNPNAGSLILEMSLRHPWLEL
jgi:GT2 family glycosyltransferase